MQKQELADKILIAVERCGRNQAEIAVEAGCSAATLSSWKSGKTTPDLIELERLSRACGRTLSFFIGIENISDRMVELENKINYVAQRVEDATSGQHSQKKECSHCGAAITNSQSVKQKK
jgi:transcriptional regulator with XRE-family HTH domain